MRFPAGQVTDDTELLLALADTLVGTDPGAGLPAEALAVAYHNWGASSPFDVGGTCRNAFCDTRAGAGAAAMMDRALRNKADSCGNGALMRVAPLAVWSATQPQAATAEAARMDARLSHPNKACQDANALFCVAIAHLVTHPGDAEGAVAAAELLAIREEVTNPQVSVDYSGRAAGYHRVGSGP